MGTIIDIVALLIVIVAAGFAYYKGFVKTFFGFVSTILAVILACVFCGTLATYIKENTGVDEFIINSIICGIIITIVNTILNYIKFRDIFITDIVNSVVVSLVTFVCASFVSFVVLQILYVINKRKQIQIEIQLEDDDEKN